jgi:hypothetical protein
MSCGLQGEVVAEGGDRLGVNWRVERSPQKVYAAAGEPWRVAWISPEFRRTEVRRSPPSIRERSVVALGVERPDVKILDAIRRVQMRMQACVSLRRRPLDRLSSRAAIVLDT